MRYFLLTIIRTPLGLIGTALVTASSLTILALFGIEQLGHRGGPYSGILTFLVLPAVLVLGLLMIPIGMFLERRRSLRSAALGQPERAFPILDLNRERTRKAFVAVVALTMANVLILSLATYKGVEVMESTEFCGGACHSVMAPEFTTYQGSPHSRVRCVACHIGPGADWFVKSKLSGSWQVISVALDLYPRPIPSPVHSLRPARETCEQCHWPSKFVGDRLKVLTRFSENEANTETKTVLLLKVGGLQGSSSHGIHWHVDPSVRIRYRGDATREAIREVELSRADGSVETFTAPQEQAPEEAPAGAAGEEEWRVMDCVDCHNRPSHVYRLPQHEIDRVMRDGKIDRSLPFIRKEGLEALAVEASSHEEARAEIRRHIERFYEERYPDLRRTRGAAIEKAVIELGAIYARNVFPEMKITWGTYPNHIGHQDSPGCFRCHDDLHRSPGGRTISQDCSTCHVALAIEEENPEILTRLQP